MYYIPVDHSSSQDLSSYEYNTIRLSSAAPGIPSPNRGSPCGLGGVGRPRSNSSRIGTPNHPSYGAGCHPPSYGVGRCPRALLAPLSSTLPPPTATELYPRSAQSPPRSCACTHVAQQDWMEWDGGGVQRPTEFGGAVKGSRGWSTV
jgi:hypothetical protein